jgi:hypothetical protein
MCEILTPTPYCIQFDALDILQDILLSIARNYELGFRQIIAHFLIKYSLPES